MQGLIIALFAVAALGLVVFFLTFQRPLLRDANLISEAKDKLSFRNELHRTILHGVTALVLLGGFLLTAFQSYQSRVQFEETLSRSSEELKMTRSGLMADRLSKALQQLASQEPAVRAGAILSLEAVADESPANYNRPVLSILSSYTRDRATHSEWTLHLEKGTAWPSIDVRTALDAIGRLTQKSPPSDELIDIHGLYLDDADLAGIVLGKVNLSSSSFKGANLRRANITASDLSSCAFPSSDLFAARLLDSNLQKTDFSNARLVAANFSNADLRGSDLRGARLLTVNFHLADLRGADLSEADLLTEGQLGDSIGDKSTLIPSSLSPPSRWK